MTPADLFAMLGETAVATAAAIVVVLALGPVLRRGLGVQAAYAAWLLVPVAGCAVLLPAPVRAVLPATPVAFEMAPAMPGSVATQTWDPVPWLLAAWLVGVAVALAWGWRGQRAFLRGLGRISPRQDGLLQAQACEGLPAVIGIRPRIVLPADFDHRYAPGERALILAHERAHVRRGDLAVNGLLFLFRCTYWFNPLAWLASARLRRDQELACDASVLARYPRARRLYGEAMLRTALSHSPAPLVCHWYGQHPLKERLQMLKQPLPSRRLRGVASLLLACLCAAGGFAAWAAQTPEAASPAPASDSPPIVLSFDLAVGGEHLTPRILVRNGKEFSISKKEGARVLLALQGTATLLPDTRIALALQGARDGKPAASRTARLPQGVATPVDLGMGSDVSLQVVANLEQPANQARAADPQTADANGRDSAPVASERLFRDAAAPDMTLTAVAKSGGGWRIEGDAARLAGIAAYMGRIKAAGVAPTLESVRKGDDGTYAFVVSTTDGSKAGAGEATTGPMRISAPVIHVEGRGEEG